MNYEQVLDMFKRNFSADMITHLDIEKSVYISGGKSLDRCIYVLLGFTEDKNEKTLFYPYRLELDDKGRICPYNNKGKLATSIKRYRQIKSPLTEDIEEGVEITLKRIKKLNEQIKIYNLNTDF